MQWRRYRRSEVKEMTQLGDSRVRPRKTPIINPEATTVSQLTEWSSGVSEPQFTCSLTTEKIKALVANPMVVPDWPSHSLLRGV